MLITIQSANRSSHIEVMEQALAPLVPVWIVPTDQVSAYSSAQKVIGVDGVMPMKPKQLNHALNMGFERDKIVITMDDDFVKCVAVEKQDKKFLVHPGTLAEFIKDIADRLVNSRYYMAGFQSNLNPSWCGFDDNATGNTGMVLGQFLAHKKNHIRFDESLTMLEDLEYIIAHHAEYGGVVRINDRMIYFHMESDKERKNQAGGYKGQRTKERQQETLNYIRKKYYDCNGVNFLLDAEVGQGVTRKMSWKKLNDNTVFKFMEK